jgi:hypothetical protein
MYSASCRFHVLGNLHNDSLTVILHFAEYAKLAAVVCLLHVIGKLLPNSRIRQSSCRLHIFSNILPITRIRQLHQLGVTCVLCRFLWVCCRFHVFFFMYVLVILFCSVFEGAAIMHLYYGDQHKKKKINPSIHHFIYLHKFNEKCTLVNIIMVMQLFTCLFKDHLFLKV